MFGINHVGPASRQGRHARAIHSTCCILLYTVQCWLGTRDIFEQLSINENVQNIKRITACLYIYIEVSFRRTTVLQQLLLEERYTARSI